MISVALVALLLPITVLASTVVLVRRLPAAVQSNDLDFLRSFGFIFFRYRPQAHWYILVILFRSLYVGFVPVFPAATGQIFLLQVAMLASLAVAVRVRPWRVQWLNRLDILFSFVILELLLAASLVNTVAKPHLKVVYWMSLLLVLLGVVLPVLSVLSRYWRGAEVRKCQYHLCHNQAEAGAFARWLKMELADRPQVTKAVFLDSDNLESLHEMLRSVAQDVDTLIVLGTKSVFYKVLCVGEMCMARRQAVPIEMIALPGYVGLCAEEIRGYERRVPEVACLTESEIGIDEVRGTLEALSEKPTIALPQCPGSSAMGALVTRLVAGEESVAFTSTEHALERFHLVVLADVADFEANAAAHVVAKLMQWHALES
eukprot:CAMPEP_0176029748 /NCGR_PEP_ID=MMETSP0120_2-20121206/14623_1 /TAXON_ID=160619 /ORGANISM="Kryptoperidinium foliaceum, Strain CCMP 1326" /LENGTH=372 /DNA_ID=CAMNT_0017362979 /DNA_START=18 /DNA_END=1133 /DNA_ORIENTATION=+